MRLKSTDYAPQIALWKILCIVTHIMLFLNIIVQLLAQGVNVYRDVTGSSILFSLLHLLEVLIEVFLILCVTDLVWNYVFEEKLKKTKIYITIGYTAGGIVLLYTIVSVLVMFSQENSDPAMPGDVKTVTVSILINFIFYMQANVSFMILATYLKKEQEEWWLRKLYESPVMVIPQNIKNTQIKELQPVTDNAEEEQVEKEQPEEETQEKPVEDDITPILPKNIPSMDQPRYVLIPSSYFHE